MHEHKTRLDVRRRTLKSKAGALGTNRCKMSANAFTVPYYGFCYFCCKFTWQPTRVIGFLGAVITLVLYHTAFQLDPHLLLSCVLITFAPFLLLGFFNYCYKMRLLGLTANDCMWPGVHLGLFSACFAAVIVMSYYRCLPVCYSCDTTAALHNGCKLEQFLADRNVLEQYLANPFCDAYYSCNDFLHFISIAGFVLIQIGAGLAYITTVCCHHDIEGAFAEPRIGYAEAGKELEDECKVHPVVTISGEAYVQASSHRYSSAPHYLHFAHFAL